MRNMRLSIISLGLATVATVFMDMGTHAQAPATGTAPQAPTPGAPPQPGGGFGRGGRSGGLPGATPEQTQAVADMNAVLAESNAAVAKARTELATVTFADVKNSAGITAAVEKLRVAELALATKRAEEFAKLQAGPHKLSPDQITALVMAGGNPAGGARGGGGGRGPAPGGGAPVGRGGGSY